MKSLERPSVGREPRSAERKPDPWGIDSGYEDAKGKWRRVNPEIKRRLKESMGTEGRSKPPEPGLKIINQGQMLPVQREAELTLEDGTRLRVREQLPPDLPLGYHRLRYLRSRSPAMQLIIAPAKCYMRENFRTWGWALQLYSLRSAGSWGIGDLSDLRAFAEWAADEQGAGIVMTNPLNPAAPGTPQQPSPYSPTSRIYRNPLYLRIDEIDRARDYLAGLEEFAKRGDALNREPLIDRDSIYLLKMEALEALWQRTREQADGNSSFKSYEAREGEQLTRFAAWCALAEQYGANWLEWPEQYRAPSASGFERFVTDRADRVRFHAWLQFLLEQQLASVSAEPIIMQDLPIGVDPAGADAWAWQGLFAPRVSVGAPPDLFNTQGQDWGLVPFVPYKLRAAGYEPFVKILRAAMRHSAGLRIDHVMGLFRLFWIPNGAEKQKGTYVRYRADELLAILALESVRARAFVVGEDLGTVEEGVRETLAARGVLSYKVMWFEKEAPETYSPGALAAVTTHDLPTVAGLWTGADLREQEQMGLKPNVEGTQQTREELKRVAAIDENTSVPEVVLGAHRALAKAPSAIVIAAMEDALQMEQRPNLPGTLADQRPNWSMPFTKTLKEIQNDSFVKELGETIRSIRSE